VKSGDSLWAIAKKYYGNGAKWPKIHAANKDKVKNPNLIYPGQKLVIP
ncbi:LysM peptidoglycan-binding domain-containing protein, partial [Stenotrophomonas maltophilia group sp. RNC7]